MLLNTSTQYNLSYIKYIKKQSLRKPKKIVINFLKNVKMIYLCERAVKFGWLRIGVIEYSTP